MQFLSQKWGPIIISAIVICTFSLVLFVMLTHAVTDTDLMKILVGGLAAKFSDIVSFWIGSSSGSKAKDELLNKQNEEQK